MHETLIRDVGTQPPGSRKMIEVTVAADGSRVLISPDIIGEIRDVSRKPGRHLQKWGRTLIRHKTKRAFWMVSEDFDVVRMMLGCVTEAEITIDGRTEQDAASG